MSELLPQHRRIASWSAAAILLLAAAYLFTGAIWIVFGDYPTGQAFSPAEPYLTILRVHMLLLVVPIIVLFATVHQLAPQEKKAFTLAAFGFTVVFATITAVNNFLLVTVLRTSASLSDRTVTSLPDLWTSVLLPLELLAWGPVFGLALLFAATVFDGGGLRRAIRAGLLLGGSLCLANVLCFVTGDLRFSIAGIVGYDFVFPAVCLLLLILFRRERAVAK